MPAFATPSVRVQPCHHQGGRCGMWFGADMLLKLGSGFLAARISICDGTVLAHFQARPWNTGLSNFLSTLCCNSKINESEEKGYSVERNLKWEWSIIIIGELLLCTFDLKIVVLVSLSHPTLPHPACYPLSGRTSISSGSGSFPSPVTLPRFWRKLIMGPRSNCYFLPFPFRRCMLTFDIHFYVNAMQALPLLLRILALQEPPNFEINAGI